MNRIWQVAAVALALALAGCGGDDEIKVEPTEEIKPPAQGDTATDPIPLGVEQSEFMHTSGGATNAFFSVNLPVGLYTIWMAPKPVSPLNDSKMMVALDPGFSQTPILSSPCCGPSWTSEVVMSNLATAGTVFTRVYAESPTSQITYGLTVLTGAPSGTSIGSGSPTVIGSPQLIGAGETFAGSLPASSNHYYRITAATAGRHVIKVTGLTGSTGTTMWNAMTFTDPGYSLSMNACVVAMTLPAASCLMDVPLGTIIYFRVNDMSGSPRTYDVSVIGP